jgi:phosphatidate cytidylyltransferase
MGWEAVRSLLPHVLLGRHLFASYMLYILGFVAFVLNLRKTLYRQQVEMFGWTHMALLTVVASSSVIMINIREGLFWFVLPATAIIVNDTAAYLAGFFFGATPLIKVSHKERDRDLVGYRGGGG